MGKATSPVLLAGLLAFGAFFSPASMQPQAAATSPSTTNLAGAVPPSFDQEVLRVEAEVDRIEADSLAQMQHTQLDRQA
jgi:cytochrome c peroxidase